MQYKHNIQYIGLTRTHTMSHFLMNLVQYAATQKNVQKKKKKDVLLARLTFFLSLLLFFPVNRSRCFVLISICCYLYLFFSSVSSYYYGCLFGVSLSFCYCYSPQIPILLRTLPSEIVLCGCFVIVDDRNVAISNVCVLWIRLKMKSYLKTAWNFQNQHISSQDFAQESSFDFL